MITISQDQINEMVASGKPLHVESVLPLSEKEKASFNSNVYGQMFMYVVLGFILAGAPFIASKEELSDNNKIIIAAAILIAYAPLLIGVFIKMRKAYSSSKVVVKGFITAKAVEKMKKDTYYSITIGSKEISVDYSVYNKYEVGDAGEFHYFNAWGCQLLKHAKIDIDMY